MKKIIYIFLILIAAYACGSQGNNNNSETTTQAETIDPANLETIEIAVYGMTCGGCEKTVKTAVGNLPGVQEVTASHTDSTAIVTFDKTKSGFEEMKVVINDKGYQAIDYKVVK
jgi:copper chaperone